jgi:hypothetical protein
MAESQDFKVTVNDASETVVIEPPKDKSKGGTTANVDTTPSNSSQG